MKRLLKVKTVWSSNLAYAIGVIATDGNLSPISQNTSIIFYGFCQGMF
jgi:hypothetical protein